MFCAEPTQPYANGIAESRTFAKRCDRIFLTNSPATGKVAVEVCCLFSSYSSLVRPCQSNARPWARGNREPKQARTSITAMSHQPFRIRLESLRAWAHPRRRNRAFCPDRRRSRRTRLPLYVSSDASANKLVGRPCRAGSPRTIGRVFRSARPVRPCERLPFLRVLASFAIL